MHALETLHITTLKPYLDLQIHYCLLIKRFTKLESLCYVCRNCKLVSIVVFSLISEFW